MFSSTQNRMQESIDNSSLIWVGSKFAHSKVKTAFTTVRFTLDACSFHMKYFSLQHYKRLSKNMAWPSLLKVLSFLLKSNLCLCPFKVSPSLKEELFFCLNKRGTEHQLKFKKSLPIGQHCRDFERIFRSVLFG